MWCGNVFGHICLPVMLWLLKALNQKVILAFESLEPESYFASSCYIKVIG